MAVLEFLSHLEGRQEPTTTLQGWRRFVDAEPAQFPMLPDEQWKELDEQARLQYDEARTAYHAEIILVATSTIGQITNQGRLLTLLNQREIGARRGLIVSGQGTTGKSTALKQFGRAHELRIRARYPNADRIPVVYVTTPPKGSPRQLAMEFARFLGLSIRNRLNTTDVADAVCQVLVEARTDVVLVDEIHNLKLGTISGDDMSDHLKYFTEHIPATFVYAGIDVEKEGLFSGTRGHQIAGRSALVRTGPFPYQQEWRGIVAAMESALRLHRHEPGTLPSMDRYLHQRTGGRIGSLSSLIRCAAISAILDESEHITRDLLENVNLDWLSESDTRGSR